MPVFDYECKNCGEVYEELVMSGSTPDSQIKCPACGELVALQAVVLEVLPELANYPAVAGINKSNIFP